MAVWTGSFATKLNLDLTVICMMERLPKRELIEVLYYLDKTKFRLLTTVSSKYCAVSQPLVFRRTCIGRTVYRHIVLFVEQ